MITQKERDITELKLKWKKYVNLKKKMFKQTYEMMWVDDNGNFAYIIPPTPITKIEWEMTCLEVDMVRLKQRIDKED